MVFGGWMLVGYQTTNSCRTSLNNDSRHNKISADPHLPSHHPHSGMDIRCGFLSLTHLHTQLYIYAVFFHAHTQTHTQLSARLL
jgi:hypothetical protein